MAKIEMTFLPHGEESAHKYEGSSKDWSDDYREAKRRGQSTEDYEGSARDRIADNAGQKRLDDKEGDESIKHPEGYKQGVAAYSNRPKAAHGYGHSASQRDGHLRRSGVAGAHQIGKKG